MKNRSTAHRGFTLVEVLVVISAGAVVMGLLLDALIETNRVTEHISRSQQAAQEALIISQGIEKAVRLRTVAQLENGGAAATPASGGGASQVPESLERSLVTTITAVHGTLVTPATTSSATPRPTPRSRDSHSSAPPSVRQFLTSGTAAEQFSRDKLQVQSRMFGRGAAPEPYTISTDKSPGGSRVVIEQNAGRAKPLGAQADRFNSEVVFSYATQADAIDTKWVEKSPDLPRLVKYRVAVWPKTSGTSFDRKNGYEVVSAVEVP